MGAASGAAGTSPKLKLAGGATGTDATGWPGVSTLAAGAVGPAGQLEGAKACWAGRPRDAGLASWPASSASVDLSVAVIA